MTQNPHNFWMERALNLAWKGRGSVSPNPMVGACVVKQGRFIAEGYHQRFGSDHAEIQALKKASTRAKGATLYVTLEPCTTYGKTPPCVDAVIRSGIREVVIGAFDPNHAHHGKGVRRLRQAGLRVITGVLAREVERQNRYFFKWVRTGLPYVTLKMAQSLDGKIASRTGASRWISGTQARKFVHRLRLENDAVMVGKNTWKKDNPQLTPHMSTKKLFPGKPWRIVLDPHGEAPEKARMFQGDAVTLQVIDQKYLPHLSKRSNLRGHKSAYLPVPSKNNRLDLKALFKQLGKLGVAKLLVEGGGELAWSLFENRLVDRLLWIVAPTIMGGRNTKTSVEGSGVSIPDEAFYLRWVRSEPLGRDWLFEAEVVN